MCVACAGGEPQFVRNARDTHAAFAAPNPQRRASRHRAHLRARGRASSAVLLDAMVDAMDDAIAPLVEAIRITKEERQYHILMIVADGKVDRIEHSSTRHGMVQYMAWHGRWILGRKRRSRRLSQRRSGRLAL